VERVESEIQRLHLVPLLRYALVQMVTRLERSERLFAAQCTSKRQQNSTLQGQGQQQGQQAGQQQGQLQGEQQAWQRERSLQREKDRDGWTILHRRSLLGFVDGYSSRLILVVVCCY
jgi:hypothetical protein